MSEQALVIDGINPDQGLVHEIKVAAKGRLARIALTGLMMLGVVSYISSDEPLHCVQGTASIPHVDLPQNYQNLRVATFNVHGETRQTSEVSREIARVLPDIVFLNEVYKSVDNQPFHSFYDAIEDEGAKVYGTAVYGKSTEFKHGDFGNAILTKLKRLDSESIQLPFDSRHEPRTVLMARLQLKSGDTLLAATTHLTNSDDVLRQQQMETALDVIEHYRHDGEPLLFGGDFNAEPSSGVYGQVRELYVDIMSAAGLGRAITVPEALARRGTWIGPLPVPQYRRGARFDYIFADGVIARGGGIYPSAFSDHCLALADVSVPLSRPVTDLPPPRPISGAY